MQLIDMKNLVERKATEKEMLLFESDAYENCEDCKGEGVVEKTLSNDGIEYDAPVFCGACGGSGRVPKEVFS